MVQLMPPHPKTPSSLASFKSRLGFTFLVLFLTPNQQCQRLKALLLLADFVASFPVAHFDIPEEKTREVVETCLNSESQH